MAKKSNKKNVTVNNNVIVKEENTMTKNNKNNNVTINNTAATLVTVEVEGFDNLEPIPVDGATVVVTPAVPEAPTPETAPKAEETPKAKKASKKAQAPTSAAPVEAVSKEDYNALVERFNTLYNWVSQQQSLAVSKEEYDKVASQRDDLQKEVNKVDNLQKQIDDLNKKVKNTVSKKDYDKLATRNKSLEKEHEYYTKEMSFEYTEKKTPPCSRFDCNVDTWDRVSTLATNNSRNKGAIKAYEKKYGKVERQNKLTPETVSASISENMLEGGVRLFNLVFGRKKNSK